MPAEREPPVERPYEFGPFRLDAAEHVLLRGGQPVPLTPKVYDTLLALVRSGGRLVLKEQLMQAVWPGVTVAENNLNQSISTLRKALGEGAGGPRYIETVPRRGYRFVVEVRVDPPARAGVEDAVPAAFEAPPLPDTGTRRSWRTGALVAGALGAAVLGAVGLWLGTRPQRLPPGSAEPPRFHRVTSSGHDSSPSAAGDGRIVAFTSDRDGTRRIWLKHMTGGGETALTSGPDDRPRISPDGARVLFTRDDGRRSLYDESVLGGDVRRLVEDATEGDWSPDGHRIVFLRQHDGRVPGGSIVGTAAADGGEAQDVFRFPGGLDGPRWSPDGGTIALRRSGTSTGVPDSILLMAPDGTGARFLAPPGPGGRISSVAWSASGRELLYAQTESLASTRAATSSRVVRLDVATGATRTLFWIPERIHSLERAGPGRLLFDVFATRENLHQRGTSGAAGDRWLTRGQSNDRQPIYSPDGAWVVFSSDRARNLDLWRVSTRTGELQRLTHDPADDWDPALTRDGQTLLWSSNRSGAFEVWSAAADGGGARQLTRDGVDAENPTATPDGSWIVYSSAHPEKAGIWKVRRDGSQAVRLIAGPAVWPEVSPDGRFAAYRSAPYDWPHARLAQVSVRVVRLADGAALPFEIRIAEGLSAGRSRWMPDGRGLAFVGRDDTGAHGVFVQPFVPGSAAGEPRQRLIPFERAMAVESFGLSSDGSQVAAAVWEGISGLMVAEPVPETSKVR